MKDFFLFLLKLLLACLAYFSEIKNLFHAVLFFIVLDWLTGVYASYSLRDKGKKWFTAQKMSHTVKKFVFYMLAIGASYVFRMEFLEGVVLGKIVAGYIALTELKSIFENIGKIMGVSVFDEIWHIIKNQFKSKYNIDESK